MQRVTNAFPVQTAPIHPTSKAGGSCCTGAGSSAKVACPGHIEAGFNCPAVTRTTFAAPSESWISSLPEWDGKPATPCRPTADYPASAHARLLVDWLTENGTWTEAGLLFSTVSAEYHAMCLSTGLAPKPWNIVGCEFRELIGGKKSYLWVTLPDGRHRLRVYRQPVAPSGADSMARPEQPGSVLDSRRRRAA